MMPKNPFKACEAAMSGALPSFGRVGTKKQIYSRKTRRMSCDVILQTSGRHLAATVEQRIRMFYLEAEEKVV